VLESQINLADFGIDTISISAAVADVFIWGHDSDELDISIEMHGDVTYDVTFSGNLVTISNDDRFSINLGRRISDQLFIKVPHSYKGDLTIQLAAGTADVSGVEGNRLNIEMTAGEFTLNDVNYNKFRLDLAAGSFDGYNISADIDINMTAGEVNLSGDLGNTTYKAAAGSVSLDYNKMPSSINVDAAVGSVDIFLPANSRFRLRNESIMGSTSNDFESFPDTANVISINMAMGQTNIHKK
jgi:DUF4097 and DUF4098 domain-containing protein YvlB